MPNLLISRITIQGEQKAIAAFVRDAKTEAGWRINDLCPNPLKGFASPVQIASQEEPLPEGAMTQEMHDRFVAQYGTADWRVWASEHWGTDAGVFDVEEEALMSDEVVLRFSTAWSPATELWANVSGRYPSLLFEGEYVEGSGNYCGRESYAEGEVVNTQEYDVDEAEGKAICRSVGRTFDDDDEETA